MRGMSLEQRAEIAAGGRVLFVFLAAVALPDGGSPFVERVDLTRFYAMSVPRTYIRCLKDVAVPPDRALAYAQRLGVKPVDLNAAHDAMLSTPESLSKILETLSLSP